MARPDAQKVVGGGKGFAAGVADVLAPSGAGPRSCNSRNSFHSMMREWGSLREVGVLKAALCHSLCRWRAAGFAGVADCGCKK